MIKPLRGIWTMNGATLCTVCHDADDGTPPQSLPEDVDVCRCDSCGITIYLWEDIARCAQVRDQCRYLDGWSSAMWQTGGGCWATVLFPKQRSGDSYPQVVVTNLDGDWVVGAYADDCWQDGLPIPPECFEGVEFIAECECYTIDQAVPPTTVASIAGRVALAFQRGEITHRDD